MGTTLAWRWLRREWRAGELPLLAAALTLAVAAVSAVGFFTDRVHRAMDLHATELLAADLSVVSPEAPSPEVEAEASRRGLVTTRTLTFPSMIAAGERLRLGEVKAVGAGYPLRGTVRISGQPFAPDAPVSAGPTAGAAWLEARLLADLGLEVGDRVRVGELDLTVDAVLTFEPDRPGDLFALGPRLLMHLDDVPATALLQPGSRVTHRLLLAGPASSVAAYRQWLEPRLGRGESVQDVRGARPELRLALERAERFLGLAALASVLLAGVAGAMAARRYAERHLDAAAILRCLGADQVRVTSLFGAQVLVVAVGAGLAGVALGGLAQAGLARVLAGFYPGALPTPSLGPALTGLATGLVTLVGFTLPTLLRLREVPPARVLRRDLAPLPPRAWAVYGSATVALGLLVLWQAANPTLALYVLGGAAITLVGLSAAAAGLVAALHPLRNRVGVAWRYGLASIARRPRASIAQLVAFGLGIMVLLLLTVVRDELLASWRDRLPADAPNYFLINVQAEEREAVSRFLESQGIPSPVLFPMVRGRLTTLNDRPVGPDDFASARGKRLVEREFNLSWAALPQPDNRVVAGDWWDPEQHGKPLLSVEQGLAETLDLALGDVLTFQIAGRSVSARIGSLRTVQWDSFRVNFFVLTPPGVLEGFPATYVTSFHLPADRHRVLAELVRHHPSVTVLDVEALLQRVRGVLDQTALAVQYVFLFTLLAGVAVLAAAVQSTLDERRLEGAIVRALGGSRRQLMAALLAEFATLGALAGLLAGIAAGGIGAILASRVFDLEYWPGPEVLVTGTLAGVVGVGLAGLLGTRRVLGHPPVETLRGN